MQSSQQLAPGQKTIASWLTSAAQLRVNLSEAELVNAALRRGGGQLTAHGALAVTTGEHTGRSAADKFIVRDAAVDSHVWWDNNAAMTPADFSRLHADVTAHMAGRELYVQDLLAGADPSHMIRVRVIAERAWHALFIRNLLIRPRPDMLPNFSPDLTIIDLPSFQANPGRHGCRSRTVIACDLSGGLVLIAGTSYAGEIKKAVFTYLNYHLPEQGVLPMHCSANVGTSGDTAAFFGLSGTGKTTLSADPARTLVGDDEHGWGESGVFNFEGGCYAKTIKLSPEAEPAIFAATRRFGTVLENVILDETGVPDLDDGSLTENTRAAYPLDAIPNASRTGRAAHPEHVVMLAADAFGVLPSIARLTPDEAVRCFLLGYTAKIAGTEKGVAEPAAVFSACFGAPFMPRRPSVYGKLLRERISRHGARCWLVNTGWTGGAYGTGRRMPITLTRRLLAAALQGEIEEAAYRIDPHFGFKVPTVVEGVDPAVLDPRSTWNDGTAYDEAAQRLAETFAAKAAALEL